MKNAHNKGQGNKKVIKELVAGEWEGEIERDLTRNLSGLLEFLCGLIIGLTGWDSNV